MTKVHLRPRAFILIPILFFASGLLGYFSDPQGRFDPLHGQSQLRKPSRLARIREVVMQSSSTPSENDSGTLEALRYKDCEDLDDRFKSHVDGMNVFDSIILDHSPRDIPTDPPVGSHIPGFNILDVGVIDPFTIEGAFSSENSHDNKNPAR